MDQPLVSIAIKTYNSSKYILETLESAKAQTYKNIELIISDDCSTDDTIELCRNWIDKNGKRFKRVEIITVEKNTGIAANCNRANTACHGTWIKGLAGDDLFLPDCIENNIDFIIAHPDAEIVFSQIIRFNNFYFPENIIPNVKLNTILDKFFNLTPQEQLHTIAHKCILPAPTAFIKNGLIDRFGGYNTNYYFEDWPIWIELLENRVQLYYLKKETIAYRHHIASVSTHIKSLFNIKMEKSKILFIKEKCLKYYTKREFISEYLKFKFCVLFDTLNLNHNNCLCKLLYLSVVKLLNYIAYPGYIKKIFQENI